MTATGNLKTVPAGDIIIRQGDPAHAAYIIETGRVEIFIKTPRSAPQYVGTRGAGTIIGEMALIDDAPRTANVVALEDCTLIEITREDFQRRINSADPIIQMVMRVLMTRYRDTLIRSEIVRDSPFGSEPEEAERSFINETHSLDNLRLENEFRTALSTGQLSLNYQPIVSLLDGRIAGFEALMRWKHPERGFISPAIFIPLAEKSGLIIEASKWALKEACCALKRLESHVGSNPDLYMSVNFSAQDFSDKFFLEYLYQTISASDVMPSQLQLEITEGLLISQPEEARQTLAQCRAAGLKIAIDDFGTGYSSLSYLHTFPINTLKIDQSFVRDMLKNPASLELAKSIITLGQNLGMTTIAEGIEGLEEARILQDMGCAAGQGYYFAKPLPEKEIVDFLLNSYSFALR